MLLTSISLLGPLDPVMERRRKADETRRKCLNN